MRAGIARARARGLTLIELMVVMLIVVVLVIAGAVTLGQIRAADADTTANVLAGAMRYVASLAVQDNKTFRMVIDMDGRRWWVESADDDDPCSRFVPDDADPPAEASVADGDGIARADDEEVVLVDVDEVVAEGGRQASFTAQESDLLKGDFAPETTVSAVLTSHHQEPQTAGKAAIYFYPNGLVERAFVWVAEETEEGGSVLVEPEITLTLEALGQVQRFGEVLPESDFHRREGVPL